MNPTKLTLPALAVCISLCTLFPSNTHAAPDAAQVVGDLQVDGIHFAADGSVQTKASPWGYGALNGTDIGILQGSVGIGTLTPSEQLELTGNLKLPTTTVTTGQIRQSGATLLHTFGANNLFVGTNAGNLDTTGILNTGSGANSLNKNTTGSANTASGYFSLGNNTTGYHNTAIGFDGLFSNTTGNQNTASGALTLSNNTTGTSNTASGYNALAANSTGNYNTANGVHALRSNTIGANNTANGSYALFYNSTGYLNTASGNYSLYYNTTGYNNTAFGSSSLYSNTTGTDNTASGYNSLYSNTMGFENTANGVNSLFINSTGSRNTANGAGSLRSNTTGGGNTASGSNTLYANTTGSSNTAIGELALKDNTTGGSNAACGSASLYRNTTGEGNTASGLGTLLSNTDGNYNVALGYESGYYTTGSNNILIGNQGVAAESGIIRIGTGGTHTATFLAGDVSIEPSRTLNFGATIRQMINLWGTGYGIGVQDFTLYSRSSSNFAWYRGGAHSSTPFDPGTGGVAMMKLDASGNLTISGILTQSSDARLKTDILPLEDSLNKLLRLRGVSYTMKADESKSRKIGVIAQEVEQEYPELVMTDDKGNKSVAYANLTPVLIEAVKALKTENDLLKADNEAMRIRIERIEKLMAGMK